MGADLVAYYNLPLRVRFVLVLVVAVVEVLMVDTLLLVRRKEVLLRILHMEALVLGVLLLVGYWVVVPHLVLVVVARIRVLFLVVRWVDQGCRAPATCSRLVR